MPDSDAEDPNAKEAGEGFVFLRGPVTTATLGPERGFGLVGFLEPGIVK